VAGRRLLDPESETRIEERIDAERHNRALYSALGTLSESDRALIEMIAIDEIPVTDAAAALGIRPGTARVRLHRLRRYLQITVVQPTSITTAGAAS
jgi:RNA polymerase sigma-70 factor (ECF subfamily)